MGTQLVVLVVERTKLSMLRRKVAERLVAAKKTQPCYFQWSKHDANQRFVMNTKMRLKQNMVGLV
jgi:hypothetical protein